MDVQLATITQKGQVTIPANVRNLLGIKPYSKVAVSVHDKAVRLEPTFDILDFAPIGKAPKGMTALKAREDMQVNYKRI